MILPCMILTKAFGTKSWKAVAVKGRATEHRILHTPTWAQLTVFR
jgi:hypothetical protein